MIVLNIRIKTSRSVIDMEQSSNIGTQKLAEQVVATLESNDSKKGTKCILTNEHLYIDGTVYFVTYLGAWKKVSGKETFDLKDITSVSYQKRSNPSKAVLRFFAKLALIILFLIISIMIGQLMYDYSMDTSSFEFWCLFFVVPPLLATIIITLISNRVNMLRILIGSETIYIKTS